MKYVAIITYYLANLLTYTEFDNEADCVTFIHDITSSENAKYRRGDIDVLDWEDDSELYVRNYFAEPWQDVHELKSAHQH